MTWIVPIWLFLCYTIAIMLLVTHIFDKHYENRMFKMRMGIRNKLNNTTFVKGIHLRSKL